MESSDLELLKTYLNNALDPDNELRRDAENKLKDVKQGHPEQY